jgi:hypothetical protein
MIGEPHAKNQPSWVRIPSKYKFGTASLKNGVGAKFWNAPTSL